MPLGRKMIYPDSLPVKTLLKLLYPCLIRLDEYLLKASSEANDLKSIENRLRLVAESLDSRGLYIFDDGFRYVVWFGRVLPPDIPKKYMKKSGLLQV
ncbi:protein transport protein Sec24-like [Prunus yedoensis var. nudiflora]|uniref:Protein transport protein Sec24-like n=1 Tax=Prunus yedoensis var. nudiflora TaxID=2094558 RepID=A0A314XES1_PRUYE|nr:protein transport protein Sec24-like [Prunus yedoensis var. nudiflora]